MGKRILDYYDHRGDSEEDRLASQLASELTLSMTCILFCWILAGCVVFYGLGIIRLVYLDLMFSGTTSTVSRVAERIHHVIAWIGQFLGAGLCFLAAMTKSVRMAYHPDTTPVRTGFGWLGIILSGILLVWLLVALGLSFS